MSVGSAWSKQGCCISRWGSAAGSKVRKESSPRTRQGHSATSERAKKSDRPPPCASQRQYSAPDGTQSTRRLHSWVVNEPIQRHATTGRPAQATPTRENSLRFARACNQPCTGTCAVCSHTAGKLPEGRGSGPAQKASTSLLPPPTVPTSPNPHQQKHSSLQPVRRRANDRLSTRTPEPRKHKQCHSLYRPVCACPGTSTDGGWASAWAAALEKREKAEKARVLHTHFEKKSSDRNLESGLGDALAASLGVRPRGHARLSAALLCLSAPASHPPLPSSPVPGRQMPAEPLSETLA